MTDPEELLAGVAAVVGRYDDEAWVALANRGLLRRARKDLDVLEITLTETDGVRDRVSVAVADHVVSMGTTGPADATCTCASTVLCQHIITAGLWLATATSSGTAGAADSSDPAAVPDVPEASAAEAESRTEGLHAALMALGADALTTYAGLPGYRWAHQYLDDLDDPPALTRSGYLAVTLTRPELTVRYFGGGLDGLVVDQNVPHVERYRVAAVLAWQRAHGLTLPAPPPRRAAADGTTGTTEAAMSRTESRTRLRGTAAALLRDMVAVGVSHLSPAIHDRVVTTATWSQGVEYHRLARMLRRIADHVDLMLVRSAAADDLELLDDLSRTHALVAALDAAVAGSSGGAEPVTLVGRARTTYDPVRSLELVGLGGVPWRTGSGYHGLTCVFWSPTRRRMYTWTDTRPESVPGFDPRQRWAQPAPWTGLATPATSAGRRVVLTNAHVSHDGRLSGVEATSAALTALDSDDLVGQLPVHASWADVAPAGPQALIDPVDPASAWVVLQPAQAAPAHWDPADQTLTWMLLDHEGQVASLRVPWSRLHAHAIERLEALDPALPEGTLVVARVRRTRGRLLGEPLSVVMPGRAINPVDSLHFDQGASRTKSGLVTRLLRAGTPDRVSGDDDETGAMPAGPLPAALAGLRVLVEQEAQRGCSGAAPGTVVTKLNTAHSALRSAGFPVFTDAEADLQPTEALLRSLYLVQQVETALA